MSRPRILDLFCGAFGAGIGYVQAGFEVVGIDNHQRRDLPDGVTFIKADVLEVFEDPLWMSQFDAIHASPPCQTHTRAKHLRDAQGKSTSKINLIPETRAALQYVGLPYIIENVPGAPLAEDSLLLCGSMFPELNTYDDTGRRWLQRHRLFETSFEAHQPRPCQHKASGTRPLGVYASKNDNIPSGGQTARTLEEGREVMGIDWMSWAALIEAIPPAYTRWIAGEILRVLDL